MRSYKLYSMIYKDELGFHIITLVMMYNFKEK